MPIVTVYECNLEYEFSSDQLLSVCLILRFLRVGEPGNKTDACED